MTNRDRVLGWAGQWKLGDRFPQVIEMLPEDRRAGVRAGSGGSAKLAAFRRRERRRIDRLFGALDPRLRNALLRKQR